MICWSCDKEMPDTAKHCPHCEAEAHAPPSPEEKAAVEQLLAGLSPEMIEQLQSAFENSETGEEFVNMVMIGACPRCGGSKTGDCENDPEIDNPCVGRCFDCGLLWCADCEEIFATPAAATAHDCPAWEGVDFDDLDE